MTDAAQLREALSLNCGQSSYVSDPATIKKAAQTLLNLLEAHGDGIQGLIDGTHYISECDIARLKRLNEKNSRQAMRNAKEG